MAYVYLIHAKDTALYKIGIADVANARLANLQIGSPIPLELVRSVHCDEPRWAEKFMHDQLSLYREHGEWFCLDDKQLEATNKILDIIEDWRPKPKLVSLMVRYGLDYNSAMRQVYYAETPVYDPADKEELEEARTNSRREIAIEMFRAGHSQSTILNEVWGVTTGRAYIAAGVEFQGIIRGYLHHLEQDGRQRNQQQ